MLVSESLKKVYDHKHWTKVSTVKFLLCNWEILFLYRIESLWNFHLSMYRSTLVMIIHAETNSNDLNESQPQNIILVLTEKIEQAIKWKDRASDQN